MLCFISDMHLTDQTLAPNVPKKALDTFIEKIKELSEREKTVDLIMLGDIFDILRSSEWLFMLSGETIVPVEGISPWDSIDDPIERTVSRILEGIKREYGGFFNQLKEIENVNVTWVPGNHDRLIKITNTGKDFLKTLDIRMADHEIELKDDKIYACHGHCFDEYNSQEGKYDLPCFGDAIVVELIDRFQFNAAQKCGIVNLDHPDISFLGCIEYVYPHSYVPIWIHRRTETISDNILRFRIRKAWSDTVKDFIKLDILKLFSSSKESALKTFVNMSKSFKIKVYKLVGMYEKLSGKPDQCSKKALERIKKNKKFYSNYKYFIMGHTHEPDFRKDRNGTYFINTGWWIRAYETTNLEKAPYFTGFNIVKIYKDKEKPDIDRVSLHLPMDWEYPKRKRIGPKPSFSFHQARETPLLPGKEALIQQGLVDLFTDTRGLRLERLVNVEKEGFDIILHNGIKPSIFGRRIAVQMKHNINVNDIDNLYSSFNKVNYDRAWLFTFDDVSESIKRTAEDRNITIFNLSHTPAFETGTNFGSLLRSARTPSFSF
jgi:UDP-2,3-diacylglucosamine pyrophosphatase LpxH